MNRRKRNLLALLAVMALLLAACNGNGEDPAEEEPAAPDEEEPAETDGEEPAEPEEDPAADDEAAADPDAEYDITLIVGVTGDEFYVSMECGAREAAEELGVNLDVQGASTFAPTEQIPVLESVVAEGPDAILIAPTDSEALQAPIQAAADAGIEIVLVDTTLEDPSVAASAIASDNYEGGQMAAEALAELMGEEGAALVVNVTPGISTTDAREEGFADGIAEYPNIEYIGAEYSDNEPARAAEIVTATLAAEPELSGIFGTNLFSAEGSATGLRQEGREDVSIVGFDAGPAQIDQLEEGLVQALIAQQPIDIGRQGIEQAVAALQGEPTEEEISTGFVTVTADNMNDPDVEPYLYRSDC